jgi:hypothetical protein
MGDLGVDERMILERILQQQGAEDWIKLAENRL